MNKIFLGLAIHNHQPVGNFPWVFQDAYERAYLPMLEALQRHPSIKVSLHYSGCLFDWIMKEHPEFIQLLKALVSSGQAEMMGGGYYEPILVAIPDADKLGQLDKMSDFIENVFGKRPEGMWLAERVWEPSLAGIIPVAGLDWTLVDDTAFKMIGKDEDELFGYFNTEEQGHFLKIFPISKHLRYSIPWHNVDDVINYLRSQATESGDRIVVLGDDGEKFGVWPDTYQHCWTNHWVDDFFKAIEDSSEWLSTMKPGDFADGHPPAGRIYLPCAAYDEMMEWSLPADKSAEYVDLRKKLERENQQNILGYMGSGYWRNFMVKYTEINRMHKKMLLVHEKVHMAKKINADACGIDELWQAQCNCPYWHGVFGGIYLSDIRAVTYSNLVKAEKCADRVLDNYKAGIEYRVIDYDGDGYREILAGGQECNLYLSPREGGSIIEWDYNAGNYNLLSTMSRRPEAYHKDLVTAVADSKMTSYGGDVKSIHDGLRVKQDAGKPVYDSVPRSSLLDRFLDSGVTLTAYEANEFKECGDFLCQPYTFTASPDGENLNILFRRSGRIKMGLTQADITLEKQITLAHDSPGLEISYKFINHSNTKVETIFGSEWNINLLGGGHNESAYYRVAGQQLNDAHLDSRGEIREVSELFMGNSYLNIEMGLKLDRPLTLWRFPVESISNSEGGVEKVYQASCVVILMPLNIKAGNKAEFYFRWEVGKKKD